MGDIPEQDECAPLILRLDRGWELYNDRGIWRWYKESKPGFDDELPTEAEVAFLLKIREMGAQIDSSEDRLS